MRAKDKAELHQPDRPDCTPLSQKAEADLKPAGDNKLVAAGVVLSPGAKVVAVLNNVAGRTVTVRFNVK